VIHLLDVNVLLALGYTAHVHNDRAETWLQHLQNLGISEAENDSNWQSGAEPAR
jgi:predicted nucleic acid-binding protein